VSAPGTVSFRSVLLLQGKTATGLVVPDDVVEALAAGKKPAVVVSMGEHSYRSSIARRGEQFLIPVSAEQRAAAGIAAGDQVDVTLTLDTAPREVVVPDDLAAALASEPTARAFFEGLSYSRQRGVVEPIEGAKAPETRQRRVAKAVELLRDGRDR
jgi:Bacteriocin-protection, YdeI or OmpD-Associated/Domain of unknown function (DUF1905)